MASASPNAAGEGRAPAGDQQRARGAAMPRQVVYVAGSSRKVAQLTGEFDRERLEFTLNRTETRFGLAGTDLGASFPHNGRIYFLFGDTNPSGLHNAWRPPAGDSIAYTTDTSPGPDGIRLQFVTAPDELYRSPQVPGVTLGSFEVPTGGFSASGRMYVFFTTD